MANDPLKKRMKADGKEGKGLLVFLVSARLSFSGIGGREKRRLVLGAGALPSFLPPWIVQALHRLCRLYNSNFWKHKPKSGLVQRQWIPAICMVGFYSPP